MYIIDTNVLIEAKNRYYSPAFFMSFWEVLPTKNNICSIDMVKNELSSGNINDFLSNWIKTNNNFFMPTTNYQANYQKVANNINRTNKYKTGDRINNFLGGADPWLIAYAMEKKATVVTSETLIQYTGSPISIKIPNVCADMKVRCINTFEMLKEIKATFIWQ